MNGRIDSYYPAQIFIVVELIYYKNEYIVVARSETRWRRKFLPIVVFDLLPPESFWPADCFVNCFCDNVLIILSNKT